jgi:hypothetical protein
MQLLDPPEESRRALERPAPMPLVSGAAGALLNTRAWLNAVLKRPYQPPSDAAIVAFPEEAGRADVVRAAYPAGGLALSVARTRWLGAFRIEGSSGDASIATAERVAQAVFAVGEAAPAFVARGSGERGVYGVRDFARGRRASQWPHWLDAMQCWVQPPFIGFVTVCAFGAPAQQVLRADAAANVRWFDRTAPGGG